MSDEALAKELQKAGFKEFEDWQFFDDELWVSPEAVRWIDENTSVSRLHLRTWTEV